MRHHLYAQAALLQLTAVAAGISVGISIAAGAARASDTALTTPPAAHCKWGDFGCTNPPPLTAPQGAPAAALECNKDLSTPSECWTNCKTEDEITICDIIDLDAFWPESPATPKLKFTGQTVTKTSRDRQVVGHLMTR